MTDPVSGTFPAMASSREDWMTGLPRQELPIQQWPDGRRVAVAFVLYLEEWGFGQGPNLRPEMTSREPDLVNESFRVYAMHPAAERIARLFAELGVPISLAVSASYAKNCLESWQKVRAAVPEAALLAHGINNSDDQLPLSSDLAEQVRYIERTLDLLEESIQQRPTGWSSPSVDANADTFSASTEAGILYSLDAMDSDQLSILQTPEGPLTLVPYPTQSVDMGHYLGRNQTAGGLALLWRDWVEELVREAATNPESAATVVAIGIHPFVVGTPDGTAAMRRLLGQLQENPGVWLTDTDEIHEYGRRMNPGE